MSQHRRPASAGARPAETDQHHRWTAYFAPALPHAAEEASSITSSHSRTSRFTEEINDVTPPSTPPASQRNFPLVNHHHYAHQPHVQPHHHHQAPHNQVHYQAHHQQQQPQPQRLLRRKGRMPLRRSMSSDRIATAGGTPRPPSAVGSPVASEQGTETTPSREEDAGKRASMFSRALTKKTKRASFFERSLTVLKGGFRRDKKPADAGVDLERGDIVASPMQVAFPRSEFPFSPIDWTDPVQRRASYAPRSSYAHERPQRPETPPETPTRAQAHREAEDRDDGGPIEMPSMSRFSISTDGGDIDNSKGLVRRILSKPWRSLRERRQRREAEEEPEPQRQRSQGISRRARPPPIKIIRQPLHAVREEERIQSPESSTGGERLSWAAGDDGAATSATEQIAIDRRVSWAPANVEETDEQDASGEGRHNDSGIFIGPESYRRSLPVGSPDGWRRPEGMRPPSVRPITEAWWDKSNHHRDNTWV